MSPIQRLRKIEHLNKAAQKQTGLTHEQLYRAIQGDWPLLKTEWRVWVPKEISDVWGELETGERLVAFICANAKFMADKKDAK